jgi:hypothetical protein
MNGDLEIKPDHRTSGSMVDAQIVNVNPLLATRRAALGLTVAVTAGFLADRALLPESAQATEVMEPVNVKSFGATGNGVTDDTAAIQAAFNAGKTVLWPGGKYKTTAPIKVPPGVGWRAYGAELAPVGCHAFEFEISSILAPSVQEGLWVVGDGSYEHDAIRIVGDAAQHRISGLCICNNYFRSWRAGIHARDMWESRIAENVFLDVWSPIQIQGQCVVNRVLNNTMILGSATGSGSSTAILVAQGYGYGEKEETSLRPQDYQAYGNGTFGYQIGIDHQQCLMARYRDNDLDATTLYGIRYSQTSGGLILEGNWIGAAVSTFLRGIYGTAAAAEFDDIVHVVDNEIEADSSFVPNAESIGVDIQDNQSNVRIEGNHVQGMGLCDIRVQNCKRARLIDNHCRSVGLTNSIYVIGTSGLTYLDRNDITSPIFVDPNEGTNGQVYVGVTYGAQSTYIKGMSTMTAGKTEVTTPYASLNGKPSNFIGGAPSYLGAHLRIGAPEVNLGAFWGTASNEAVTIHCEKAPTTNAVIRWEVTTQGHLD